MANLIQGRLGEMLTAVGIDRKEIKTKGYDFGAKYVDPTTGKTITAVTLAANEAFLLELDRDEKIDRILSSEYATLKGKDADGKQKDFTVTSLQALPILGLCTVAEMKHIQRSAEYQAKVAEWNANREQAQAEQADSVNQVSSSLAQRFTAATVGANGQ